MSIGRKLAKRFHEHEIPHAVRNHLNALDADILPQDL
jgi:hypothetical protein